MTTYGQSAGECRSYAYHESTEGTSDQDVMIVISSCSHGRCLAGSSWRRLMTVQEHTSSLQLTTSHKMTIIIGLRMGLSAFRG